MKNNFVAIDFETSYGHIPCSIGIVEFVDGKVVNEYYSLIRPIDLKFNPINSGINGIYIEDVFREREFDEIWDEIEHFFIDRIIVSHNSSTDITILEKTLDYYKIHKPYYDSFCTLKIARSVIELDNYKLSTLAKHFNITQFNYHNALEDAFVCGMVFYNLYDYSKNIELNKKVILEKSNRIKPSFFYGKTRVANVDNQFEKEILKINSNVLEEIIFVISGVFEKVSREELKLLIEQNGGKVGSAISTKTNYVIAGENMGPSKRTKAEELKIKIISENDFLKLIE